MVNCRATIKCPTLAQFPAKGISPDEIKNMKKSDILNQTQINEKFNARGIELGDILISKLKDVDITWCNDGCFVISCSNTLAEMEKVISDEKLEIKPDRSDIKHKVRQVDPNDQAKGSEEDIDEVFEPLNIGEKTKLKKIVRINQFKAKQNK